MDTVIYKKSDRDIVAYVHPRGSDKLDERALALKLENICENPNLGGAIDDYGTVKVENAFIQGQELSINENLEPVFTGQPKE